MKPNTVQLIKKRILYIYAVAAIGMTLFFISCGDDDSPANKKPEIQNQNFAVDENSAADTEVGMVKATDAEEGKLTYSITAGNGDGYFAINGGNGQITVAANADLDHETTGSYSLTVRVEDPGKLTAAATMTVTVNDVNEAPVFAADTYTGNVAENAIVNENVVTVKATDEDDTDTPAYAITGGNTNDDFKIAASGLIAVAKSLVGKGGDTYTLTVTASDDESPTPLKDDATVTITVTATAAPAVNQPPTFADAMREVAENAAAGSNVGAAVQAADPESDAITYAITGGNTGDVFAIDNNGQITIAQGKSLDHEGTGSYTLTVTATDAAGSNTTVQAAITITVNDVNEAPVFATDAYTRDVPENTAVDVPIGVTVSATDEDDTDTPTYEITGGNTNDDFKIDTNTGVISVAKALTGKNGDMYTLTVTASDDENPTPLTAEAEVTINVTAPNVPPKFAAGGTLGVTLDEDVGSDSDVKTLTATDEDGEDTNITYAITNGDSNNDFVIDMATGAITVGSGGLDFETTSSYTLTVTATDEDRGTATVTFSITVNDVNEHDPMIGDVASIDFTVAANASGGDEVGTAISATDADTGQTLTYTLSGTGNENFDISSTGQITVSNSASLSPGDIPLIVTVMDDVDTRREATVNITISVVAPNTPLTFTSGSTALETLDESVAANTNVRLFTADANDVGQNVTYSLRGTNSDDFSIDAMSGQITVGTSGLDFETTSDYTLTVVATDDGTPPSEKTRTFSITVNDVNDNAPVINSGTTANAEENQTSTGLTVTATDDDTSGSITYRFVTGGADNGKFSLTGGVLAFRSAPNFENPTDAGGTANDNKYVVRVEAYDEVNTSASQDITITVTDVNDPPEIGTIPDNLTITDGASNTDPVGSPIPVTDEDRPAQTLNYNLVGTDADGTFSIGTRNGQIVVNNASNLNASVKASYSLTVTVTDEGRPAETDMEDITISVTAAAPENNAPTVVGSGITDRTVIEGFTDITIDLSTIFTDANRDDLTYTVVSNTASSVVTASISGSTLTIARGSGTGTSTITVMADDDSGGTVTDMFDVTVEENMSPTFDLSSGTTVFYVDENAPGEDIETAEETPRTSDVLLRATDPEGSDLTYGLTGENNTDFTIDAGNGKITVAKDGGLDHEAGNYTLVVTVSDENNTIERTITINVEDVNDAPVLADQTFDIVARSSPKGTEITVLNGTDDDDDESSLTYRIENFKKWFQIVDRNKFQVLADDPSTSGVTKSPFLVEITVSDDDGDSSTAVITVNFTE